MSNKPSMAVVWPCDKKDCMSVNYRILTKGQTIIEDECDVCGRRIVEPLWEEVENPKIKHKDNGNIRFGE
jgi:hypothetical protein